MSDLVTFRMSTSAHLVHMKTESFIYVNQLIIDLEVPLRQQSRKIHIHSCIMYIQIRIHVSWKVLNVCVGGCSVGSRR